MSAGQDEIDNAIEIVRERGFLILPNGRGGGRLDGRVIEELLLDAVDEQGEVNPHVLALARQIIANA